MLGIIDQSILRERWLGVSGRPTTLNGTPIRTRACAGLADAVLMSTSPLLFDERRPSGIRPAAVAAVRQPTFGGDCYAYGLVAAGFADLVVEAGLKPYDFCALIPVLRGPAGS